MNHTALAPAGPFAEHIAQLFWLFVGITAVIYVLVIGALVHALLRRRRAPADETPPSSFTSPRTLRAIGVAVGVSTLILVVMGVADFLHARALAAQPENALRILVTAKQWWWEIEYHDPQPSLRMRTANEFVIPVGRPVMLQLESSDVIHSFWVPNLQGKKDLLPGYTTKLALLASRAGVYGGQCAEFCGFQHAHMNITLEARNEQDFAAWLDAQRAAAPEPANETERRGRDVFLRSSCKLCHAITGTEAAAVLGPDLTHFGSRRQIAAGAAPNDAAHLAQWIVAPQSLKPGTRMPSTPLSGEDVNALVAYLGSLK